MTGVQRNKLELLLSLALIGLTGFLAVALAVLPAVVVVAGKAVLGCLNGLKKMQDLVYL